MVTLQFVVRLLRFVFSRTLLRSLLFLLVAGSTQVHAFTDEWDWRVSGVAQSFPTKADAVAYLHGPMAQSDPRYALLTQQSRLYRSFTEASEEYLYEAPKIPPLTTPWRYFDATWGAPNGYPIDESEWVADRLERLEEPSQCPPATLTPTDEWTTTSNGFGAVPDYQERHYTASTYQFLAPTTCKSKNQVILAVRERDVYCPSTHGGQAAPPGCRLGFTATISGKPNYCSCASDSSPGDSAARSNPVNAVTGDKFETARDYTGPDGLYFERYFHSRISDEATGLGTGWSHNYQSRIILSPGYTLWGVVRPNGYREAYQQAASGSPHFVSSNGLFLWSSSTGMTWRVYHSNGTFETYNSKGNLVSITRPDGGVTTLAYSGDLLTTVTGPFGHKLQFEYDADNRLQRVITPSGGVIEFGYTGKNLTSVLYPDGASRAYHYEDASFPGHLTGVTDEKGVRYSTFAYDSIGRATLSKHAGDVDKYEFAYNAANSTVTDPLGTVETIGFSTASNRPRKVTQTSKGGLTTVYALPTSTSDVQRRPTQVTDPRGLITTYTYTRFHVMSKTEASGTPLARTTSYAYLDDYSDLPTLVTEPGRTTAYVYDTARNVLTRTVTDTSVTPNVSRTWTYTYNANGRVLTEDGPRTDVNDVTTYTYYACTTGAECGQLQTVTKALSQTTTFNSYNAHGQPLSITDANGVVTTLAYDLRQRLTSRTVGGETTTFEYWPTGLLKKTTLPDGSYLLNTYDDAHRLIRVEDGAGNRVEYTLDNAGNRTAVQQFDPSNALVRARTQVFNSLGQLWKQVGAAGTPAVTTTFTYDNDGNQSGASAPLGRNTTQLYDELNRLKQVTDPGAGVTQFGYDARDNLVSVRDPNSNTTSYSYDAFGGVTQLVSPDTGTTVGSYDTGGNLASMTDGRGKTGVYAYDALNRPISLTYPDQTLSFTYDSGVNGLGRLTGASDANHSLSWAYDPQGRVTSRVQTVGAITKTINYSYTNGNLTSLVTPSGQTLSYSYANGRVAAITLNGGISILHNVLHDPFGPVGGWTWGNGTIAARVHDLDGNLTALDSAGAYSFAYDDAFRITGIEDLSNAAGSWTYGYDSRDRVAAASSGSSTLGYSYDNNGNRLAQTGSSASTFTPASGSNRLASVSGALNRTYSYDGAGNVTGYSGLTFSYSDAGRLTSVTNGGVTTSYVLNALGQRVRKANASSTTLFVYDEAGHLLGEYGPTGALIQETVWFGDIPVATLRPNGVGGVNVYYVHADHLGTPRRVSRPIDNAIVWQWESDPFGVGAANEDVDGDSVPFAYNLRFPGQHYDTESGLAYNYFRDYDAATGRYVTSDPIGLAGGTNTYGYVGANPIEFNDPYGLEAVPETMPRSTPTPPPRAPVIPFPRQPPMPGPGAGPVPGLGLLSQCMGAIALALVPSSISQCQDTYVPEGVNCPDDEERCGRAISDARRMYKELSERSIPQYMYNSRMGQADPGHHQAIQEGQARLRDALRRIQRYCKVLPADYDKMERLANQVFPVRH